MKARATALAIDTALRYIEKDPEKNLPKLLDWVDRFAGDGPESFAPQRAAVRVALSDPENNMRKLAMNVFHETDSGVLKATFRNFFLNANLIGWPIQEENREKYGCNIPWAILLDPTSACNLHCTGCWAAEYGNKLNLSREEIDDIIRQGKELGVYMYIYTGGEPLVRARDLIALCEAHPDCQFLCFTNGTLIDDDFAEAMLRVRNFIPALSVEGFDAATDARRGEGTYARVLRAMDTLHAHRLPFGLSCCYTSQNLDDISSDAFIDEMTARGARFVWYFHYMPVGSDAVVSLLPSPAQREKMLHRVRELRATKPIFCMDFQNDAEYVGGCIAGGRRYLHINANGDVDPCVFIHYSNVNLREHSLLDALRSPLFMAYHDGQPFNENHLRPCPMLENPERIRSMVKKSGAHSTDLCAPEDVDALCGRCTRYAQMWKPEADRLWQEREEAQKNAAAV